MKAENGSISASRVVVVGLGGTIAMSGAGGRGATPALSADELVAAVPGLVETGISVEVVDFRRSSGASLTFDDFDALGELVRKRFSEGVAGVVVTQGTDTIEESAYLLDIAHREAQPIVFTGAMRNPSLAGADGPANLLAAIQVAASSFATNLGVLVVIADEIHSASRVQKSHRTSGSAFRSPNGGPLGYVSEGCPRILNRPTSRPMFPPMPDRASVEIGLVTVSLGDNGSALDALADNVDGLVIAGFGAGHVPSSYVGRLERLALRIPVVLSSRIGAGTVLKDTYAFRGSESDLLARGLISAGYLDSFKARILLRHLVAARCSLDGIRRYFEVAGGEGGHDSPSPADMGSI
ncbi:MAG: asparaginase [Pseudonocardia sp.]